MKSVLHVEQLPPDKMGCTLEGDPIIVAEMLLQAMKHNQELCAAMIFAVLSFANEKNVTLEDLARYAIPETDPIPGMPIISNHYGGAKKSV